MAAARLDSQTGVHASPLVDTKAFSEVRMESLPPDVPQYDVLLIGAGFGSFSMIKKFREQGLSCKIFEAGSGSGGTWFWNSYPGARVDSEVPVYQLFDKELYEEWTFTERFPGREEIRKYFEWVEKRLDITKDIEFNRRVAGADWDESREQWLVRNEDGSRARASWLILATGVLSKKYLPDFKGLNTFKGDWYHTGWWPQEGVEMKGRRVAVVGTGASGIQVIQETGVVADQLFVYQRTPNYTLPMNQRKLDPEEEEQKKTSGWYAEQLAISRTTFSGFPIDALPKKTFDDTPEERAKTFHDLLVVKGGFHYWIGTYQDMLFDQAANDEAYKFWRETVRKRIPDPRKAELLAPTNPPHPWGCKRPSMEQNYYEVMSRPNVDIVDISNDPIIEITEQGIRTSSGVIPVDTIVFATGWDAGGSGLTAMDLRGVAGEKIADHFANGYNTAMGVALAKFPNLFYINSLGSPAYLANGPSAIQYQAEWIDGVIKDLRKQGVTRIEAKPETELAWRKECNEKWDSSLFPKARSWYQGLNIPGKRAETIGWSGGVAEYIRRLHKSTENGYQAWTLSSR